MPKHYTIPIFVPELACPHRCAFCNQRHISGQRHIPHLQEAKSKIENYLQSIPQVDRRIEIGFFGGSFTGIAIEQQAAFLSLAQPYLQKGDIQGIRLSTRPDYIDKSILQFLKDYGVSTIELGAQSTHREVLRLSERGHSVADIKQASEAIKTAGFNLGLQMMLGLPGDSYERSMQTAKDIVAWGADESRIYPCLVVKNTQLAKDFMMGKYKPLSLSQAVEWSKDIWTYFQANGVIVIRIGLHPSEEFESKDSLLAGPYHHSFKALVMSAQWYDILDNLLKNNNKNKSLKTIYVPHKAMSVAIGQNAINKNRLAATYGPIQIKPNPLLQNKECYVDNC